jgi:hypothetical protein
MLSKSMALAAALFAFGTVPALADGKIYVQLPQFPAFSATEAEDLLHGLVAANVVSSNCAGFEVTEEEWSLLVDSADMIAFGQLGLSVDDYDDRFYKPAFDALDQPGTCANEGPGVETLLGHLVRLGGSREPLPDQDAAYAAHQQLQAQWDARAGKGPKIKS